MQVSSGVAADIITDDAEARLLLGCAGVLKHLDGPLPDGVSLSTPFCRAIMFECDGKYHMGARWTGQVKPEDNGYAVFISSSRAQIAALPAQLLENVQCRWVDPDF